jgi:hypothetical protein
MNLNIENKYIENEKNNDNKKQNFFERLWNELKVQVKKYYKLIILITIVSIMIMYVSSTSHIKYYQLKGGAGDDDEMAAMMQMYGQGDGRGGESEGKSLLSRSTSPMSGGIDLMWWMAKNIILVYTILLLLVLIPSVPILLYITVFYFIMKSLLGNITDV